MRIAKKTIDSINQASKTIFEAYGVNLHRGKALCPFHLDSNPSFTAKPDPNGKWFWKCQSCQESGGDIISFVARMEGKDANSEFRTVVEHICKLIGIELEEAPMTEESRSIEATKEEESSATDGAAQPLNEVNLMMAKQYEKTTLFQYLCRLFEEKTVRRIFELYQVGRGLQVTEDYGCNGAPQWLQGLDVCSSFPSIDAKGDVHSIKIIPYPVNDHHRIKDHAGAPMIWKKPLGNSGAYFGTHLLPDRPCAPVAIVESEKTALLGAIFDSRYIWIATQGKGNLRADNKTLIELKGRALHLFPDVDGLTEWAEVAEKLKRTGYNCTLRDDLFAPMPKECKLDIGDFIIWEAMFNKSREEVAL